MKRPKVVEYPRLIDAYLGKKLRIIGGMYTKEPVRPEGLKCIAIHENGILLLLEGFTKRGHYGGGHNLIAGEYGKHNNCLWIRKSEVRLYTSSNHNSLFNYDDL